MDKRLTQDQQRWLEACTKNINYDDNLQMLFRSLKSIMINRMRQYMKVIPYYDEEDYFQTGIIVLWNNIERVKNNHKIAEYFLSYYAVSVSHAYANLFRDFVMKNDTVIEIRVNDGSGYNIVRVKSFQAYRDKLKRRKKEYYETHREQIRERDRKRREEKKKQKLRKKRKCEQSKKYYAVHREEINRKRRENYAIKKQIKLGCHSNLEGEEH